MANSRNYRTPTEDDDADVPYWNDVLAQDVAKDVDAHETALRVGGMPREVEPEALTYLDVDVSKDGRIRSAVRPDGTFYVPHLETDRQETSADVQKIGSSDEYLEADTDSSGRLTRGLLFDGTQYFPRLKVGSLDAPGTTPALEKPRDYHLTVGQSKATPTDFHTLITIDADARVYQMDTTTKAVTLTAAGGQDHPGWATARAWAQSHMSPDRLAVWARIARGETGFSSTSISPAPAGYSTVANGTWDRTLVADPLNLALELLTFLAWIRDNSPAGSRVFIHWNQGEQDRTAVVTNGIAWYKAKLDDLLGQCSTVLGTMLAGITVGAQTQATIDGSEGARIINEAQEDTPRRLEGTAFVPPIQDNYRDAGWIHYTAAGSKLLGIENAAAIFRARYNRSGARPSAPQRLAVNRYGSAVTITWEPPAPRYQSFAVEYSTDDGATWIPATLRHVMALTATATVAAGTPLKVRASATNDLQTSAWTREVKA